MWGQGFWGPTNLELILVWPLPLETELQNHGPASDSLSLSGFT